MSDRSKTTDAQTTWLLDRTKEIDPSAWASPMHERLKKRRSASLAYAKLAWNTREIDNA